jgi:hypothetical protein
VSLDPVDRTRAAAGSLGVGHDVTARIGVLDLRPVRRHRLRDGLVAGALDPICPRGSSRCVQGTSPAFVIGLHLLRAHEWRRVEATQGG